MGKTHATCNVIHTDCTKLMRSKATMAPFYNDDYMLHWQSVTGEKNPTKQKQKQTKHSASTVELLKYIYIFFNNVFRTPIQ